MGFPTREEFDTKANDYFNSGLYKEALSYFDEITSINPNFAEAWYFRGEALRHLGEFEQSVESYNIAIKLNPNFAEAWYRKGIALAEIAVYAYAVKCFDMALLLNPDFAQAWYYKGFVYFKIQGYTKALEFFDRATSIDPNFAEAWYFRGEALRHLGEFEQSVESYNIWIKTNRNRKWKDYLTLLAAKIRKNLRFFFRIKLGGVELESTAELSNSRLVNTIVTEMGIEGERIKTTSSTEASKKIEEGFKKSFEGTLKNVNFEQITEFREFSSWFKREIRDDPEWLFSRISNDLIKNILETTKPYYSNLFMRNITSQVESLFNRQSNPTAQEYRIYNLSINLQPLEVYVELAKFIDEVTRTATARLTFRIDTDLKIDSLKANESTGLRVYADNLVAKMKLSVSRITISQQTVSYLYKPMALEIVLDRKEFSANDIYIINSDRYVNIWIEDYPTHETHKADEPLIKGKKYYLMIKIDKNLYPKTSKDQQVSNSKDDRTPHKIFVSVISEAFKVADASAESDSTEVKLCDEMTQKIDLSKSEIPEAIAFIIEPKDKPEYKNIQKLKIYFHYKQNILQFLSVSLKVISAADANDKTDLTFPLITRFKQDETSLPVDVVASNSFSFDIIPELEG